MNTTDSGVFLGIDRTDRGPSLDDAAGIEKLEAEMERALRDETARLNRMMFPETP